MGSGRPKARSACAKWEVDENGVSEWMAFHLRSFSKIGVDFAEFLKGSLFGFGQVDVRLNRCKLFLVIFHQTHVCARCRLLRGVRQVAEVGSVFDGEIQKLLSATAGMADPWLPFLRAGSQSEYRQLVVWIGGFEPLVLVGTWEASQPPKLAPVGIGGLSRELIHATGVKP